ncbi:30S ribosomal protein S8 [Candidatus Woesebacteria bacterium RIFCSPLOWO2_01_FULL_37_19]|uniref:Small ribosomal subunit protein uS8 n=2 Tax=Candidatus Woeseibacteriota TaxID=1752722 RepID=A0A1F8B2A2_9BACT|nr:MAG: 30S ribosomal protein S8 [Candidatus Woesebacteria bacterium RIFCSPHIGHO2_01_FULL_38_26b]OGM58136.1 MAG: 30S ribosomal protein S8 [Candidatus Woesebacteria bacterium RIFCSPLOWO2_01_FULL_37_19]
MTNYPVGDFLIRIKNAAMIDKRYIEVRNSKLIEAIAMALKKEGYLDEVKKVGSNLSIRLTFRNKKPLILDLKLVSTPGLRVYKGVDELKKVRGPRVLFLSTPKGVMSLSDAVKNNLGGEIIVAVL